MERILSRRSHLLIRHGLKSTLIGGWFCLCYAWFYNLMAFGNPGWLAFGWVEPRLYMRAMNLIQVISNLIAIDFNVTCNTLT